MRRISKIIKPNKMLVQAPCLSPQQPPLSSFQIDSFLEEEELWPRFMHVSCRQPIQ